MRVDYYIDKKKFKELRQDPMFVLYGNYGGVLNGKFYMLKKGKK